MVLNGYGYVKEVLSGDTLVVIGQPSNGPPPELKLTLASLSAPKLALKSQKATTSKDPEPFAWQSREYLRTLCIGKKVYFKVEYTVQAINRQFGAVYLLDKSSPKGYGENLCITIAREGWAQVKAGADASSARSNEKSVDLESMLVASKDAEDNGRGIFQARKNKKLADESIRTVKWELSNKPENDPKSEVNVTYAKLSKKPQKALIEYVRDGASFKVILLESMTSITFNLAGVQCPRMNSAADKGESDPQDFAQEAKFFSEVRLLNREVMLNIGGVSDRYSTFFGSMAPVSNSALNISVELIRNGLAMPVDWSMSYTTADVASAIHSAVHIARDKRLRLWKNYKPPVIPGEKAYEGVVTDVVSGETLLVRVGENSEFPTLSFEAEERRVSLSSIRAPKLNRKNEDDPYARKAKEFLRSRLIGATVRVEVEYILDKERKFGTVFLVKQGGKKTKSSAEQNVACMLLESGLAQLLGHKQGAERSAYYHNLIESERQGKEKQVNIWSNDTTKSKRPVQVSNAAMAKGYTNVFQSQNYEKKNKGIVEYVFNGSRFKVYVPDQDAMITFSLAGVLSGRTNAKPAKDGVEEKKQVKMEDSVAEKAAAFSRALVHQKEIEFTVESIDKGGNFIGNIFINVNMPSTSQKAGASYASQFSSNSSREYDLSILLLQKGLARTSPIGIRFAKNSVNLRREENEAIHNKVGMWVNYVPEVEAESEEEETPTKASKKKMLESIEVQISHIESANKFFLHLKKDAEKFKKVETEMAKFGEKYGTEPCFPDGITVDTAKDFVKSLRLKQLVAALFNDGTEAKFYRAKVISKHGNKVAIHFIDFGNEGLVAVDKLKLIDDSVVSFGVDLKVIQGDSTGLAYESTLAFAQAPELSKDYGREAAMYFAQLTLDGESKVLNAKLHNKWKKTASGTDQSQKLIVTLVPATTDFKEEEHESEDGVLVNAADTDGTSVNALMVREGLALVPSRARLYNRNNDEEQELFKQLKEEQENAHKQHVNLWMYGDPREDEDE
eukprot:maker-scaffold_49-snap-gene-0.3-mRNA-1 protein AED:0.01 eAED:0.01 QI:48/1/0.75/1/1/1/4/414/1015